VAEIVGIRFKRGGKVYYFDPAGIELEVNDWVVVKTTHGLESGYVVIAPKQVVDSEVPGPLKPVAHKAKTEDIERIQEFEVKSREALAKCGELIAEFNLPMKLLSAEHDLSGKRLTFFFSATERVDFRQLVRELNKHFKIRVELRQVGSRDEAKLIGGFGRCGRPLCCMNFLCEFTPVSIKMAKEQDLSLNPMKISGVCGRLMCCLGYESESYHVMREKLPRVKQRVSTPLGAATVVGGNPLKETVLVKLESGTTVELPLGEITLEVGPSRQTEKED